MSIELPTAEVYALADALRARAGTAREARVRLGVAASAGGPLEPAVEEFLVCSRMLTDALAGELEWLGVTVAGVADSWVALDASLLARRGGLRPE
jgi:hypothetical protein